MAFKFVKSNCVVVGTFNVYIIQPKWLGEVKILPDGLKMKIEYDLRRPGFRLTSQDMASKWMVRPDRLIVESEEFYEDCGSKIAKVLDVLRWTPLMAVGMNSSFTADLALLPQLQEKCGLKCDFNLPEQYKTVQNTWHVGLGVADKVINIQLAVRNDALELDLNAHTELSGFPSHLSASQEAIEACQRFVGDRKEAIALAEKFLEVEFEYADDNAP